MFIETCETVAGERFFPASPVNDHAEYPVCIIPALVAGFCHLCIEFDRDLADQRQRIP